MTDPRKTIDELCSILQSADLTQWQPAQIELIKEYSRLCGEATRRLSECESLLGKNLYSEAVQLSQATPDLLELVALLELPDREVLEQVSIAQKIQTPPSLNMATFRAIEQAYLKLEPLEDLLKHHRLLALARAPLTARRKVLQQIAERDHDNPIWKQDLVIWETELLKQLQDKLKRNDFLNNPDLVLEQAEALHDGSWLAQPSPQLLNELEKAERTAEQVKARQTFMQMKDKIQDAFHARDIRKITQLREEWKQTAQAAGLSFKDSITQHVADAFRWVAEIEAAESLKAEQAAALNKLNKALDSDVPVEVVQDRWNAYVTTGAEPTSVLQERFDRHINRRLELRQDRRKLTWIAIGGGVLALLIVATIVIVQVRQNAQLSQAQASLKYFLDENKLSDFQTLYDRLVNEHTSMTQDSAIAELHREYRNRTESKRTLSWEISAVLAEIKTLSAQVKEPDVIRKASTYLSRATDQEREQLKQALANHENQYLAWNAQEKQNARNTLDAALKATATDQASAANIKNLQALRKQWKDTDLATGKLEMSAGERTEMQSRLKQLDQQLAQQEKLCEEKEGYDSLQTALLASLQQPGRPMKQFSASIHQFVQRYPNHSGRAQWIELLNHIAHSEMAAESGELILSWKGNPFNYSPKQATEQLQRLEPILAHRPKLPEYQQLLTLQDILKRRTLCVPAQPMITEMNKFFKLPGIKEAAMIQYDTGGAEALKQIYLSSSALGVAQAAIKNGDTTKLVTYYSTLAGKEATKEYAIKGFKKVLLKSPQTELADTWERAVRIDEVGWPTDTAWRNMLASFLDEVVNKELLDPVAKLDMIRSLVERGSKGSLVFERAAGPWNEHLKNKTVRNRTAAQFNWSIEWIDPRSTDADRLRIDCAEVIKTIPHWSKQKMLEDMNRQEGVLQKELLAAPILAGWMQRVSPSEWKCEGQFAQFSEGSLLMILVETPGSDRLSWQKIGTLKNHLPQLAKDLDNLREGTPCFVILPYADLPKE